MGLDSEELCDVFNRCLLPELQTDIGTDFLDEKHFEGFRHQLNDNLHAIFDLLHEWDTSDLLQALPVRLHLTLVYSEQTAKNAVYQTDQTVLMQCLEALRPRLEKWLADQQLWDETLGWYKKRVTAGEWKRNIGASHGLARMCEVIFANK